MKTITLVIFINGVTYELYNETFEEITQTDL